MFIKTNLFWIVPVISRKLLKTVRINKWIFSIHGLKLIGVLHFSRYPFCKSSLKNSCFKSHHHFNFIVFGSSCEWEWKISHRFSNRQGTQEAVGVMNLSRISDRSLLLFKIIWSGFVIMILIFNFKSILWFFPPWS